MKIKKKLIIYDNENKTFYDSNMNFLGTFENHPKKKGSIILTFHSQFIRN